MIPPRAMWRVKKPTTQPDAPSLDGLLEEGTDAIPVRITIVQDDVTTGWDDGALGFEDGAVWFSGRATSFRLAAPDILPGAYLLSRREPVTDGEALNQGFPLRHPTRGVWVRVRVLTKDKEEKAEHERRLIAGVKRLRASGEGSPWREARPEGGTVGEGVSSEYPPLTVRPGMAYQFGVPMRLLYALAVLEAILFVAAFVLVVLKRDEAVSFALTVAFAVFLALGALMQGSERMEAFRRGEGIELEPQSPSPDSGEAESPALVPPGSP